MPKNAQSGHNSVTHPRARTHAQTLLAYVNILKPLFTFLFVHRSNFIYTNPNISTFIVCVCVCVFVYANHAVNALIWSFFKLPKCFYTISLHLASSSRSFLFLPLLSAFGIARSLPLWLVTGGRWPLGLNATRNICCVLLYFFLTLLNLLQLFSIYAFAFISDTLGIFSEFLRASCVANGDKELLNQMFCYLILNI